MSDETSITLFTDASYDHKVRVGGWGAWCKGCERSSQTWGGYFRTPLPSADVAELGAIANAIRRMCWEYVRPSDRIVMVESDSTAALGYLLHAIPDACARPHVGGVRIEPIASYTYALLIRKMCDSIRTDLARLEIALHLRHIHGHQQGRGRAWVQRECDRIARLHMRTKRNRIERGME